MASLVFPRSSSKGPSLQWYTQGGERRTLYLGKVPKPWARDFARHAERLIEHVEYRQPVDRRTTAWLAELGPKWRAKLAAKGLASAQQIATLGDLAADYTAKLIADGAAASTIEKLKPAVDNLFDYFDATQSIHSITPADAADYAAWLKLHGRRDGRGESLAASTTAKQLKTVSGLFRRAVEKEVAHRNPFKGLAKDGGGADAQQYVAASVVESVLEHCEPSLALRVALTRYAGLRHPSEVDALELEWANLPARRLLVYSPKNRRYEHKRWREVPIAPALVPWLEDALERAPVGEKYLACERRGITATAWRGALERACKRAAVVPWRSLWHSLRGSRAVDLLDDGHPEHVVCYWQNTGPKELRRHYLRATDDHFAKAAGLAVPTGAAKQAEPRVGDRIAQRSGVR